METPAPNFACGKSCLIGGTRAEKIVLLKHFLVANRRTHAMNGLEQSVLRSSYIVQIMFNLKVLIIDSSILRESWSCNGSSKGKRSCVNLLDSV